ncbi:MAG: hypothetical protein NTX27_22400 [Verrucomicrobia bacterium]|nr:hypothetical protein [Verrucomicrobiota bacterium]
MRKTSKWIVNLCASLVACWLTGCTTPIPGASHDLISFLKIGETTRETVLLKLGQPSAIFEHERILTYRVGEDPRQGRYILTPRAMMPWQHIHYSLVLVFDDHGRLAKQNLITVN